MDVAIYLHYLNILRIEHTSNLFAPDLELYSKSDPQNFLTTTFQATEHINYPLLFFKENKSPQETM